MKLNTMPDFIVIDDDSLNNLICRKVIELNIPGACTTVFIDPQKGLDYMLSVYSENDNRRAVLFLDINMPCLSGWEVLDQFSDFPPGLRARIEVFMLSSSVNPHERAKADNNPLVSGYITKSLSGDKLRELFPELCKSSVLQ